MRTAIWPKRFSLCRVDSITEIQQDWKAVRAERKQPRKRPLLGKPLFPNVEKLVRRLEAARDKSDSMEKVEEISGIALAMYDAGSVAKSYDAFAEAVRAAYSLPVHLRQDALSLVRAAFSRSGMDMLCYEGLLRTYQAPPQLHDAR